MDTSSVRTVGSERPALLSPVVQKNGGIKVVSKRAGILKQSSGSPAISELRHATNH
jgi:hypothetical protein